MQNNPNQEPEASPDAIHVEADRAFDEFLRGQHVVPYGRSGLRNTFEAGFRAARGEQAVAPEPPKAKPVYALRKRMA